jgi:hypothetical protein
MIVENLLKKRLADTDEEVRQLKEANNFAAKSRPCRVQADTGRRGAKGLVVGQVGLQRVARGEMEESPFRTMMDEGLSQRADRAFFGLD